MVEDRVTDGHRIAQLLASEFDGRSDGVLADLAVADADPDVEPTVDGDRAYDVVRGGEGGELAESAGEEAVGSADEEPAESAGEDDTGERVCRVYVQPDRAHLSFSTRRERAAEAADEVGLRVRPKATTPPKTLVFVESGAEVKRAVDVVERALDEG